MPLNGPATSLAMPRKNPLTSLAPWAMPLSRPPMTCLPASMAQAGGEWMPSALRIWRGSPVNQL